MEDNYEHEGVDGELVNFKARPSKLDCTSEDLADGPSCSYCWCQNIEGP